MAQVATQNVVLGGIADSDYLGAENSVAEMVGWDIHSEPGVMKVNQKLTKESGSVVDDFCKAGVQCSDGNTYLFGSNNGKIFKRDSNGNWSHEETTNPSSGGNGVLGAAEYQGYIYYAMEERLGRVAVPSGSDVDWSDGNRSDDWQTFDNGDTEFHPMHEVNLVLYIGDANYVSQVDASGGSHTWSAEALDIRQPLRVSALGNLDTDLVIGTYVDDSIMRTQMLRWNTWSTSFSVSDPIPEVGVNSILDTDNFVLVNAGKKGRLYEYDGADLVPARRIPGIYPVGTSSKAIVHTNATLNYNGLPIMALSQENGNASKFGLWSFGRHSAGYDRVLNLEWIGSQGSEDDIEYGCIVGAGDIFVVSWKDNSTSPATHGVDKLDLNNKYDGAYITTRMTMPSRREPMMYGQVDVAYRTLPDSTDITIKKKLDDDNSFNAVESVKDTVRMMKSTEVNLGDAMRGQVKIEASVDGNDAPEIEAIYQDIFTPED